MTRDYISSSRACGFVEVVAVLWDRRPLWLRYVCNGIAFISFFGLAASVVIEVMLLWPDGGAQ